MARAGVLSLGFHLCIEAPGQNLLMIIQGVEEVLVKVENLVQNGWTKCHWGGRGEFKSCLRGEGAVGSGESLVRGDDLTSEKSDLPVPCPPTTMNSLGSGEGLKARCG